MCSYGGCDGVDCGPDEPMSNDTVAPDPYDDLVFGLYESETGKYLGLATEDQIRVSYADPYQAGHILIDADGWPITHPEWDVSQPGVRKVYVTALQHRRIS